MGLSIQVDANIAPAIKKVMELKDQLASMPQTIAPIGNTEVFSKLNDSINKLVSANKELVNSFQSAKKPAKELGDVVEGSMQEARLTVKRLKDEISTLTKGQLSSSYGRELTNELKLAEGELASFEKAGGLSTTSFKSGLRGVFGDLRLFTRFLPGVGLASVIAFAEEPLTNYFKGLLGITEEIKKAEKELDTLKQSLNSPSEVSDVSAASEEGNIAKVRALASAITDSNLPYAERKRALQELQEVNKSYFGDLKLEEDMMGKLTARVDEYTKALTAQAVLKGFTDEIGKQAVETVKAQNELNRLEKDRVKAIQAVEQANKEAENSASATGETSTFYTGQYIQHLNEIDGLIGVQRNKVEELATNYAQMQGSISKAVQATLQFRDLDPKGGKQVDELMKQLQALERIQKVIKDTDKLVDIGERIYDLKVRILFRDAQKNGFSKEEIDATLQGYKDELNKTFLNQAIALEGIPKLKFSHPLQVEMPKGVNFFASTEKKGENFISDDEIAKATGFDKRIPILTIQQIRVNLMGKKGVRINDIEKLGHELNKEVAGTIGKGLSSAFESVGDDIADALTGNGGLQKAAETMLGIIGSTLQEIGKQVIAYGVALLFLKSAIADSITNPAVAIAAGIGLVALGSVFKSIHFAGPKLAEGGILSGPTTFLGGEAGKEAIIPLSKLPYMLGNAGGGSSGATQIRLGIRDRDLIAWLDRGKQYSNRLK